MVEAKTEADRRAKERITAISMAAAILLTTLKLVVGLLTGSLGLLSEAVRSVVDALATLLTFFAVLIAGRQTRPSRTAMAAWRTCRRQFRASSCWPRLARLSTNRCAASSS
jgi:Co/Zn/Cd efflux system component